MKHFKFLPIVIAISFLSFNSLTAQDTAKHQFAFSYSLTPYSLNSISGETISFLSFGLIDQDAKASGAYTASYDYQLSQKISVGADVTFEKYSAKTYSYNFEGGITDWGHRLRSVKDENYLTAAASFDYAYLERPTFKMYSGLGLGITKTHDNLNNQNHYKFNYHFTGFGLRFGKTLAANIELGYGYAGILKTGLTYKW